MFREEYLENKKNQLNGLHGSPLSVGNKNIRIGIFISLVIFIFLTISLFIIELPRVVNADGELAYNNGVITITSNATGSISGFNFDNGDLVDKGQSLLFITSDEYDQNGASKYTKLLSLLNDTKEKIQLDKVALKEKYALSNDNIRQELALIEQSRHKTARVLADLSQVERNYQQEKTVLATQKQQGLVTRSELRSFNYEYASLLKDIAYERSKSVELDTRWQNLNNQNAMLDLNHSLQVNELTRQFNEIQQRIDELISAFKTQVVSPISGTIYNIHYKNNQTINKGEPLFDILPNNGELVVKLSLPSKDIGFIEVGQRVEINYDAYPSINYGKHYGTIKAISGVSSESDLNTGSTLNKQFSVSVALHSNTIYADQKIRELKVGMKVAGRIILGKRSLIDWVLSPLTITARDLNNRSD